MRSGDTIPNIPTHYREIDFASRLEARWAVFFDCYAVEWEYEPKRIRERNIWYAPDFLLLKIPFIIPGHLGDLHPVKAEPIIVEIKPDAERKLTDAEGKKIKDFLYASTKGLLLVQGSPWDCQSYFYKINDERALERMRLQWGALGGNLSLFVLWIEKRGEVHKPWESYPERAQEVFRHCFSGNIAKARKLAQYWDFERGKNKTLKYKKRRKKR